jgi:hypothetical protein
MKKIKILAAVLLTLAVSAGIYYWQMPRIQAFAPPIPALDPVYADYEFDAEKGATFSYPSGSRISFPPNVLIDEDGHRVSGRVQVKYRELHTVLDVVTSGVPLEYDSAGGKYHLQTAGMFDIKVFQGEKKLQIAPDEKVNVCFASFEKGDQYSFYEFDPAQNNWVFQKAPEAAEPNSEKIRLLDSLNNLARPKNLMVLHFGEALDIYVGYNYEKATNELIQKQFRQILKSYQLAYTEQIKLIDPVKMGRAYYPAYSLVWERLDSLEFPTWVGKNRGEYTRNDKETAWTFQKASVQAASDSTYRIVVQEFVEKSKFVSETVQDTTYLVNKKTKKKKQVIKERIETKTIDMPRTLLRSFSFLVKPYMRISDFFRQKPEKYSEEYAKALEQIAEQSKKIDALADVFRTASLSKLGMYNYDYMSKMPDAVLVKADFELETGKEKADMVYYISAEKKAVIKYPPHDWDKVRLQADPSVRIFAILPDMSIAFYDPKEWAQLDLESLRKSGKFDFKLKTDKNPLKTQADMKAALSMQAM